MRVAQNGVSLTNIARKRGRLPLRGMIGAGILAGSALSLLALRTRGRNHARRSAEAGTPNQEFDCDPTSDAVRFSLLYAVPPIWLASSLSDWACHRYSRIEETAGVKESI